MSTATLHRPDADEADEANEPADGADLSGGEPGTEPAADPPPSLEELKRTHYAEIAVLGNRVDNARLAWEGLKADTSDAKKEYEGLNVQLLKLIRRGPSLQRELPLGEGDAPLPDDSWRSLDLKQLDITPGVLNSLYTGGLMTFGDLSDYWKDGNVLSSIRGIGEASDAAVRDAFSQYGVEHPEVFGAAQEADGEVDEETDDDTD
jgi:hypothetical protein